MSDSRLGEISNTAGNLFESETFKAFVFDFYYDQEDHADGTWGDIMRHIFGDGDMYKRFLRYCRESDYGFLDKEDRIYYRIQVSFFIFEQARQIVVQETIDKLHHILSVDMGRIEYQNTSKIIPGTTVNFWTGLQTSLYSGILMNNHGEVVYIIGKNDDIYEVYSHESENHYVNASGYKTTPARRSKIQRIKLRQQIEEFRGVLRAVKDGTQIPKRLLYELERLFILDGGCQWNLNFETKIRFRSWLVEKIIEMEKDFDQLVEKDSRKPDLKLVGD
ncbi:hypothetical protein LAT59_03140 [Candidatus Gracilibacteria bacterium]|nr:hypothetical protein [Candidatus Gracilibacteria bacterium]